MDWEECEGDDYGGYEMSEDGGGEFGVSEEEEEVLEWMAREWEAALRKG
jgi:hypothetical protein